jgi:sulfoxide reductase heme-binding subunit YedZ
MVSGVRERDRGRDGGADGALVSDSEYRRRDADPADAERCSRRSDVRRAQTEHVPRFVFDAVHRNASLLAIAFLFVHIGTSLLDGFAPIRLIDVAIPFGSAYRPLRLGFGAVAFDWLIAVALTSVFRRRLGYRGWRATHWLAYASWPVAVLHGLGAGSDTKTIWMLGLTGACVIAVVVAVFARAADAGRSTWGRG